MITIGENAFRDYLFLHHKVDLASLIVGRRDPVEWTEDSFPSIRFLLQRQAERRINGILEDLQTLVVTAKELALDRGANHPTRVDLFGGSVDSGVTIIELKKSAQTERQAFTELLAYTNYFCSIFPGLEEQTITSVLVANMETRTARDAYVQELVFNKKQVLSLIPHEANGKFTLEVFYPNESYYQGFENNIVNDNSMACVAIAFPLIDGWIDSDLKTEDQSLPSYSADALNDISSSIAQKLEAGGFHAIVYANQKWGNIATIFPYPNAIFVAAINPFSSYRTTVHEGEVYGASEDGRIAQVQAIYDQLTDEGREYNWVDAFENHFQSALIRCVRDQMELCFLNRLGDVKFEISLPDWGSIKNSPIDSVFVHNLNAHTTGLLREIFFEYIRHVYEKGFDDIFYSDDLPGYAYKMLYPFLPVWEIVKGLGHADEEMPDDEEDIEEND